jgi:hypothetical protein
MRGLNAIYLLRAVRAGKRRIVDFRGVDVNQRGLKLIGAPNRSMLLNRSVQADAVGANEWIFSRLCSRRQIAALA